MRISQADPAPKNIFSDSALGRFLFISIMKSFSRPARCLKKCLRKNNKKKMDFFFCHHGAVLNSPESCEGSLILVALFEFCIFYAPIFSPFYYSRTWGKQTLTAQLFSTRCFVLNWWALNCLPLQQLPPPSFVFRAPAPIWRLCLPAFYFFVVQLPSSRLRFIHNQQC